MFFENNFFNAPTTAISTAVNLFVVEDDPVFSKMLQTAMEKHANLNISVYSKGEDCLKKLHQNPDLLIIDYNLPDINGLDLLKKIKAYNENIIVIIVSGQTSVEVVVQAYKQGADDYIIKSENCMPEIESSVKNLSQNVILRKEVELLKTEILDRTKYNQILGSSPAILNILKLIQKAEKSNILVLITGESGTGKELVARAIHFNSPRKKKPFVVVNMAAIPKDLIESELFGHEKGSFTGAIDRRIGKFEEANEGTIFLDEIGEMDLGLQSKLLRILEEKQVTRIGSNKAIKLDIRILAATNKDLANEVKKGIFREDLFYRLQGFLVHLPPLRQRREDILLLAKHFLSEFSKQNNIHEMTISKEAANILYNNPWAGNVRELKSVMERAALLASGNIINSTDLMLVQPGKGNDLLSQEMTLEEYRIKIIKAFLEKYNDNIDVVANKLNIGRATIYRILKRFTV